MSDEITASHILIGFGADSGRSQEEAKEAIEKLKTEIDGGGEFAALAQSHSDCPSSANGGDLGPFGRGMMVPEFEQAAFALDTGAVSDIVETSFGYHLIARTG
ncbi:MAG: peptidylprolyl isomerase [Alphaproteobacteria bacterium]